MLSLLLKLALVVLSDADLVLQLRLKLQLQITHLFLVVLNEVNQFEDLLVGLLLTGL
jgi:hypothetical protein